MLIAIDKIRRDGGTQPRNGIDMEVAYDYGEDMKTGVKFPPVVVFYDGEEYWLADGFHRVARAGSAGWLDIDCDIHRGTVADAQWYSFGANSTHGIRRSNDDKARAVKAALSHPYGAGKSDRAIAKHCGVSHDTVSSWRQHMESTGGIRQSRIRVGSDGRTIDTGNIGKRKAASGAVPVVAGQADDSHDGLPAMCGAVDIMNSQSACRVIAAPDGSSVVIAAADTVTVAQGSVFDEPLDHTQIALIVSIRGIFLRRSELSAGFICGMCCQDEMVSLAESAIINANKLLALSAALRGLAGFADVEGSGVSAWRYDPIRGANS